MLLAKLVAVAVAAEVVLPFVPADDVQTGWVTPDGQEWYYVQEDGEYVYSNWVSDGGKWYYCDVSGRMVCDVNNYRIDGTGYNFNSSGVCTNPGAASQKLTGWQKMYFSHCIYLPSADEFVFADYEYYWYYYGDDGVAVTGWQKINGKWYYFDENSDDPWMYYNDEEDNAAYPIDGKLYYFSSDGDMLTGWCSDGTHRMLARGNGSLYADEWYQEDDDWYYFNGRGEMIVDAENYEINGISYSFDSTGICKNPYASAEKHVGWYKKSSDDGYDWYYYNSDSSLLTGWLKDGGKWYYLDPESDGAMFSDGIKNINGVVYCFGKSGALVDGWYHVYFEDDYIGWFYCNEGVAVTGWKLINNVWYYFDPDTSFMSSNNTRTINGKMYRFAESGAMYVGWSKYENKGGATLWWYSAPDGALYVNKWLFQGGNWYYFGSDAEMIANVKDYVVNGVAYDFDENGVCLNP